MKNLIKKLWELLPTLLLLISAAAVAYGARMIYIPAGWIVGGILGMAIAVLIIKGGSSDEQA